MEQNRVHNSKKKVILASGLLFFMTILSFTFNYVEDTSYEWKYPFYDVHCDCYNWHPLIYFSEPIGWFTKTLFDKLSPIFICIVYLIRPDFKKWGIDFMVVWIVYFVLLALNNVLTYDTLNILGKINGVIIMAHFIYCVDYVNSDD